MSRSPEQILEVTSRGRGRRFLEYEIRMLAHYTSKLNAEASPFLNYVPVKLVTIIEACVREAVKTLVDFGAPYTERGIDVISKLSSKQLVESLRYLSNKRLTVGQISAYGFSVSSLSDVIAILEKMHDEDNIKKILANQTSRWLEEKDDSLKPIITDPDKTFSVISRLFDFRHIIAHEMAVDHSTKREDAEEFLNHADQFVQSIEWLTTQRLHDFVPRTQTMMNISAAESAREALKELDELRGGSAKDFEGVETSVAELEHHWDRFAQLTSDRYAGYFDEGHPGSIAPLLHATMLETLTKWRVDNYGKHQRRNPAGKPDK